jgi:hypothetical protein
VPTLLAVGAVAFLIAADAPSRSLTWNHTIDAAESIGVTGAVIVTTVSIALAISLQPLQFRLVQLLEGYWPTWAPLWVARMGVWAQGRRRDRIADRISAASKSKSVAALIAINERIQVAETQVRERFPDPNRLLPTALGNALRAAEDRVGQRYGLQSVIIWPRLFRLLPAEVRAALDDEVTQLDVSARLSVTWSLAGVVSAAILLREPSALVTNPLWAALVVGVWVLARLSYLSAVESAIAHGSDIEVAIDLYRSLVVDAMRLPPTLKMSEERRVFRRLCRLFQTYEPSSEEFYYRTEPAA